jgi:hypothetical protein
MKTKTQFDEIIEKMLIDFGYMPISMLDISNGWSGYEFNPTPGVLIRFTYCNNVNDFAGQFCSIKVWDIITFDNTIKTRNLFNGQFVLREDGDCDYNFYRTLINNYNCIG